MTTAIKATWVEAEHVWRLRWESIVEAGTVVEDPAIIARTKWETHGHCVDERFLTILVGDEAKAEWAGYVTFSTGDFIGINAHQGLYVIGWYIRPAYRRGAVAFRMIRSVVRILDDMKIPRVQGVVVEKNAEVQSLLKRHGFREIGRVFEYERPNKRPEDGEQVHGESRGSTQGGRIGPPEQSAVPDGPAACTEPRREPADAYA